MKLFIVGASGYLGKELTVAGCKLYNVTGTSSQGGGNLLRLNLETPSNFNYESFQESDVVILTAAISSPDICAKNFNQVWKVNVTGTTEFITQVLTRGSRVLFFSSDTVYGERKEAFDESENCNPTGEYAEMKYAVEKHFLGNPLFKSIRLSYVFSKEDKFTKYLIQCAENNENAEIFHPFYRAVIHRDDVVEGIIALTQYWENFPQPIINFGGPEILSRKKFVEILKNIALPNLEFRVVEPDIEFFLKRPRVISMNSPILESLLRRPAFTLSEATKIEFNKTKEI